MRALGWTWLGPALALALAMSASASASAAKVDDTVAAAIAGRGQARVMLVLAGDGAATDAAALSARIDALIAALPARARVERRFRTVPALALTIDDEALRVLSAHPDVAAVSLDPGGSGQLLESLPLAQVTPVQSLGFAGTGRKIAVIDSGVRLDHHSFAGRIVDQACFCTNCCPNGGSTQFGAGAAADDHGHGTNVTGIAAGGAGVPGVPAGAAAQAAIVAVKVLDSSNSYCCNSDIVAALDWVRVNHPDATVVNLSLGSFARFSGHCDSAQAWTIALATAVNGLVGQGTSVAACSTNSGSSIDMSAPACVQNAISVGAVWDASLGSQTVLGCTDASTAPDRMTCFSNLSPTTDLVAPGAWVTAAGRNSPTAVSTFAGTSMASPMVAGCLAQLRQAFPGRPRAALEQAILASPVQVLRPPMSQSYPRLDCLDAFVRLDQIFASGFQQP